VVWSFRANLNPGLSINSAEAAQFAAKPRIAGYVKKIIVIKAARLQLGWNSDLTTILSASK
jgi:hypothetical protein